MLILQQIILLSTCLTVLLAVPFAYAQDTQTILKPNQLITFSLAPKQEKVFVLQMKKGDFAEIQSLAREGLNLSFEIYNLARNERFEQSGEFEASIWFVAPSDGEFFLVSKLAKEQYPEISGPEKISIQYNNKFKFPPGTKLKGIRKVKGFDVKIMVTPNSTDGGISNTILLIEKHGQLQKAIITEGNGEYMGYTFADEFYVFSKGEIYRYSTGSVKTNRVIQLIKTTPEIIKQKLKSTRLRGNVYFLDELPDIMIDYSSGGRAGNETYFIELGDTVKVSDAPENLSFSDIGKNPKGGLFFESGDSPFGLWFTTGCMACWRPGSSLVILEFRNGKLRPNFDLMKKSPPSLAVLRTKAQKFRNQLSLAPYRGAKDLNAIETDLDDEHLLEDPGLFSKDYWDRVARISQPPFSKEKFEPPFWDEMLDLIYTGNEELAWQFLDLVWSPQKQGKERFIRDFKNQLLQSRTWQMILEDERHNSNSTPTTNTNLKSENKDDNISAGTENKAKHCPLTLRCG